jgi:catalase
MAMYNPVGRVNYEPNSWTGDARGPREDAEGGYLTYPAREEGDKRRIRSETFADHYSQARQFYVSQTPAEQEHIVGGFTFELSKVETPAIRTRMVANLRNVDEELARRIADGLGLPEVPEASPPARTPITDLAPSAALSIVRNGPQSFAGRKVGALVTDGVDARVLDALRQAVEAEGAMLELVAPRIGGVTASDGTRHPADQNVKGGPSVLYDAVAVVPSEEGVGALALDPAARDFVTDAHAHCKFIGYVQAAMALFDAAGVSGAMDDGYVALDDANGKFVEACRALRLWSREAPLVPA